MNKYAVAAASAAVISFSAAGAATASAATSPLSSPAIVAHFDLKSGQLPENITLDPKGGVNVTFAGSNQIAHVTRGGKVRILATFPAPPIAEGKRTPVFGAPHATGLARTDEGRIYALYAAGSTKLTGLWELSNGRLRLVAHLPARGLPNGLAVSGGSAYVADSVLGVVYRVRLSDGTVRTWANAASLKRTAFLGANGLKVRNGSVWVSNLDQGIVVRIAIGRRGHAATPRVAARGLRGIDDFAFTGQGNALIAALNGPNTVEYVVPGHGHHTILTAKDGLQGPTAVAISAGLIYVPSAAYNTAQDPNLITARLARSN